MGNEENFNLKFVLIWFAVLLVLGATLSTFFLHEQQRSREMLYASTIPTGKAIQKVESSLPGKVQQVQEQSVDKDNLVPVPSLQNLVEITNVLAVSTGKLSKIKLTDASTKEYFADATTLDFVTKANDGSLKKIKAIVQITPRNNPDKSVSLGIVRVASTIGGVSLSRGREVFTDSEIKKVFSEDSKWSLTPLTNLEILGKFYPEETEYVDYAQRYYGGSFGEIRKLIDSGLTSIPPKPVLLFGIGEFRIYNQ